MREHPAPPSTGLQLRPWSKRWLPAIGGVLLLLATLYYVQPAALVARLSQLRFGFILLGAALVLPQLCCLALRWRQTARLLGAQLSTRQALREYALSMLLNQLLPLGVAGDAVRVVRHARGGAGSIAPALQSVVLERFLGQVVVIGWALAALPLWLGRTGIVLSAAALAALTLAGYSLRRTSAQTPARITWLARLLDALTRVLGNPQLLRSQLALSSLVLLSIVAQLYCALWALGLSLPLQAATRVFPFMLLAMTLPLSFAGFGPREAATAELYHALQLSAADGAAFALAFGAVLLCSSLPCLGLVFWLKQADHERLV